MKNLNPTTKLIELRKLWREEGLFDIQIIEDKKYDIALSYDIHIKRYKVLNVQTVDFEIFYRVCNHLYFGFEVFKGEFFITWSYNPKYIND